MMIGLKEQYEKEIISKMQNIFGYKNKMDVPKIEKVVINNGVGEAKLNPKLLEIAKKDIMTITGQKPLITRAKKAISGFKLRRGDEIGLKVTFRGQRMYDFLERLNRIALPRIRDFRGLKISGFDGNGNYNMGVKEHIVFPEIKYDKTEKVFGLGISIKTNAKSDNEALELLKLFGFPFEKNQPRSKNG